MPSNTLESTKTYPDLSVQTELKRKRDEEDADNLALLGSHRNEPHSPKKFMAKNGRGNSAFTLVRTTNAPDNIRAIAEANIAEFEWVSGSGKPHPKNLDRDW